MPTRKSFRRNSPLVARLPTRYWDTTEIGGVAIYACKPGDDGRLRYYFDRLDMSPETIASVTDSINERIALSAARQFYLNPNYDIYSMKPNDDHPQVLVEVGHRRAMVDEKLARIITALWKLNLDTLGSCQEIRPGEKTSGLAYVQFSIRKAGEKAIAILRAAGIEVENAEKPMSVKKQVTDGDEEKTKMLTTFHISFQPTEISAVAEALEAAAESTE